MSSSFLNGADWAKQFISKILHVTHSLWIFRNFSLHNKRNGYLHKKKAEEIALELELLAGLAPEDVPTNSQFLLEINFSDLNKSNLESQKYWILAINAALIAQQRQLALGAWAKRIIDKVNSKLPSRTKLGIVAVEQQIRLDQRHVLTRQEEHTRFQNSNQSSIHGFFTKKCPHPAAIMSLLKSNKCLQKPDWGNSIPVRENVPEAAQLAYYWLSNLTQSPLGLLPKGKTTSGHTRQSKRPLSVQIVHSRICNNLLSSLFIEIIHDVNVELIPLRYR